MLTEPEAGKNRRAWHLGSGQLPERILRSLRFESPPEQLLPPPKTTEFAEPQGGEVVAAAEEAVAAET